MSRDLPRKPSRGTRDGARYRPVARPKRIAVVGAGPAGLAFATVAGRRGHRVTLFDSADRIGGQFNMAKVIPGRRSFTKHCATTAASWNSQRANWTRHMAGAAELTSGEFDEIVLASGVLPRVPSIPDLDHPKVLSYIDVLLHGRAVGGSVAIVGAGGIGFDVAEFLSHDPAHAPTSLDIPAFMNEWGIDMRLESRGGLVPAPALGSPREIWLLQRKPTPPGGISEDRLGPPARPEAARREDDGRRHLRGNRRPRPCDHAGRRIAPARGRSRGDLRGAGTTTRPRRRNRGRGSQGPAHRRIASRRRARR